MSSSSTLARAPRPLHRSGGGRPGTTPSSAGSTARRAVPARGRVTPRRSGALALRLVRRVVGTATTVLVLVAVAVFTFLAVGPHVLGYRTATMLTGSMAPAIEPGDELVSVPVAASQVRVGDVITYTAPVSDRHSVTHRVVSVGHDAAGAVTAVTRGDANASADPWVVTLTGQTWRTTHVVRHLGSAVQALRVPVLQTWVLPVAVGGMALLGVAGLLRVRSSRRGDGDV